MAVGTYAFTYTVDVATGAILDDISFVEAVIDGGALGTLAPGDTAVIDSSVGSGITSTFYGTAGDGALFDVGGNALIFTNTELTIGDTVGIDTGASFVICFLSGTLIATPRGEVAVEELRAGDLVLTHDGREAPVVWLGRQTVSTAFADPLRVAPVRIAAGALGEGLPVRDLLVSADHALLLDGVLVQAGALVNGRSITREMAMPERFTYYHVELADHALVLAEGVAAESFIDNAARRSFDNWAEHPGGAEEMAELALPRAKSHRQLPAALRARLAARAEALLPAPLAA
ncbi:Hint domain-containing protein [Roseomonas sp. OT10]|uniref:Hint domain-containing protein n=1 Tax=Roseomonas cutis TaxID=2897332 RepID=UPI001E43FCC3|nr:Hint domain-containing protein [Roseomonas sp. OT10]UFN50452.1 Hint domain-containing protein [Roseomonas sp. OT10]